MAKNFLVLLGFVLLWSCCTSATLAKKEMNILETLLSKVNKEGDPSEVANGETETRDARLGDNDGLENDSDDEVVDTVNTAQTRVHEQLPNKYKDAATAVKKAEEDKKKILLTYLRDKLGKKDVPTSNTRQSARAKENKLEKAHKSDQRSLWNFAAMTVYLLGWAADDYVDYGCYCGVGNMGLDVTPVDILDNCCRVHDLCFREYDYTCSGYSNYDLEYSWNYLEAENDAECTDDPDAGDESYCKFNFCGCDLVFSRCILANHGQYNDAYWNWADNNALWRWWYPDRCVSEN